MPDNTPPLRGSACRQGFFDQGGFQCAADMLRSGDLPSGLANEFRDASAVKVAEDRGVTTSPVLKHVAHSENFQAEACPN